MNGLFKPKFATKPLIYDSDLPDERPQYQSPPSHSRRTAPCGDNPRLRVTEMFVSTVFWIRIRMDPDLLPGSEIIVTDPDPAKSERADK